MKSFSKSFYSPSLQNNPAGTKKQQNFIEALKDFSGEVKDQTKAVTAGVMDQAVNQITGVSVDQRTASSGKTPQQEPPFNFADYLRSREQQIRQQERTLAEQQRGVEKTIFYRKEEETKKEIEIIKVEIKKLVLETGKMSTELQEAEKTVMETTVAVGTYHLNFFDRIKNLIKLARKRISESKNWLELFNSRNQHKTFYWAQVRKSGTRFMLSQERYMATQAG